MLILYVLVSKPEHLEADPRKCAIHDTCVLTRDPDRRPEHLEADPGK